MIEKCLESFKKEFGFPFHALKNTQKTKFSISLSEEEEIFVDDLEPGLFLHVLLGTNILGTREDLYIHLMHANFLGQGTGKSIIGLDPEEKYLTLSYLFPYEIDYTIFKGMLEDFLNYSTYWKEYIQNYKF